MAYRKLGRTSSQRKAVLRDLTTDLIINEAIVTTEARAKEIRKTVEKMITLGKRGDLHARRQAAAFVRNEIASESYDEATDKLKSLLDKKKALQTEGLMNAVMKSSRSYEEILRYIQSDSFEEQEL